MQSSIKDTIRKIVPNFLLDWRRKILYEKPITRMRDERGRKIRRRKQIQSISMSQAGQDCWVYGEVFNEKRDGYFVDIGAHDGIYISNTFLLEQRYGWDGICIEANRQTYQQLSENRNSQCINACIDSFERIVKFEEFSVLGGIISDDCDNKNSEGIDLNTKKLVSVLRELDAPNIIDYLTIDIEGAEDRALLKFPFDEYIFNCMTIERPSSSLRALLRTKHYVLVKEIPGLDCFYVHQSYLPTYFENMILFYEKKFVFLRWE